MQLLLLSGNLALTLLPFGESGHAINVRKIFGNEFVIRNRNVERPLKKYHNVQYPQRINDARF